MDQPAEASKTGSGFKFSLPANKFTTAGRAVLAPNTMMNFATPQPTSAFKVANALEAAANTSSGNNMQFNNTMGSGFLQQSPPMAQT